MDTENALMRLFLITSAQTLLLRELLNERADKDAFVRKVAEGAQSATLAEPMTDAQRKELVNQVLLTAQLPLLSDADDDVTPGT